MPKLIKPLRDLDCRRHKHRPGERGRNKLRDGRGLFLEATPSGRKTWRMEYKTAKGTKTNATLGDYPHHSLDDARKWRQRLLDLIAEGLDPNQHQAQERAAQAAAQLSTFGAAADEWIDHKAAGWTPKQTAKVRGIVARVLLPWLGKRPLDAIASAEILHCLQRYEKAGKVESAHRAREYCSAIFRRAMLRGTVSHDPAAALKGALLPRNSKNFAHLTDPEEIGGLLRAMDGYTGHVTVGVALRLSPMLFVRPNELRLARWSEFDLEAGRWDLPADRMKSRRPHSVPLASQAVALLRELEPLTKHKVDALLFPSVRTTARPISENTLNAALRRLGYSQTQQTAHGFRHMASTSLHEMGWPSHVVEKQLAHKDANSIRAIYNKAEYWPEREKMMQAWADHLDSLKAGRSKVTPIKRSA